MINRLIARLRRKPAAPPFPPTQIEVHPGEVLVVHLRRPLPEALRSLAAGDVLECLTPFVDGNTVTSIRKIQKPTNE